MPVDPAFASLNVAQSVLVFAYEWRLSGLTEGDTGLPFDGEVAAPADKAALAHLFAHLESALDAAGYFRLGLSRALRSTVCQAVKMEPERA